MILVPPEVPGVASGRVPHSQQGRLIGLTNLLNTHLGAGGDERGFYSWIAHRHIASGQGLLVLTGSGLVAYA